MIGSAEHETIGPLPVDPVDDGRGVALDLPVELYWGGVAHAARTSLVSTDGALVLSEASCPLWARIRMRNMLTGASALCRVDWCWVDASGSGTRRRLALKILEGSADFWEPSQTTLPSEGADRGAFHAIAEAS